MNNEEIIKRFEMEQGIEIPITNLGLRQLMNLARADERKKCFQSDNPYVEANKAGYSLGCLETKEKIKRVLVEELSTIMLLDEYNMEDSDKEADLPSLSHLVIRKDWLINKILKELSCSNKDEGGKE